MSKKLTIDLIHSKTKTDNLNMINNLNLWGIDLENVDILLNMPNLENLSLSVNKIQTLKSFSTLYKLKQLYLRNNLISELKEIQYLKNLKNLEIIWLSENPISKLKLYREFVIKNLPNLKKLDDKDVTNEERIIIENTNFNFNNYINSEEKTENLKKLKNENLFKINNFIEKDNFDEKIFSGKQLKRSFTNKNIENDSIDNIKDNEDYYINYYEKKELLKNNKKILNKKITIKEESSIEEEKNEFNIPEKVTEKDNIMAAILILLNDLNNFELEVISKEINKKLNN